MTILDKAKQIMQSHPEEIDALGKSLAMDFDTPAQRLINRAFASMGIDRFTTSGDDLWEAITAIRNGWDYDRPPRYLVDRWASY